MQRQPVTETEKQRQTVRERHTQRESYRHCQRDRYIHSQTETATDRDSCRERGNNNRWLYIDTRERD